VLNPLHPAVQMKALSSSMVIAREQKGLKLGLRSMSNGWITRAAKGATVHGCTTPSIKLDACICVCEATNVPWNSMVRGGIFEGLD